MFLVSSCKVNNYFIFAQSIEARCYVQNEDVVGAAPTGDAPTTSELPTIVLPIKVWLILEVLRYYIKSKFVLLDADIPPVCFQMALLLTAGHS